MCKVFYAACLIVLKVGILIGCHAEDKEESTKSSLPANAAHDGQKRVEKQLQYMAVCTTTQAHEGNEYILTKWLNTKDKALIYGREHARKRKGHVVVYNEREKP